MGALVCWHIWEARNEVRNSHAKVCPATIVMNVIAYVEMIATHCLKPSPPLRCAAPKQIKKRTYQVQTNISVQTIETLI